MSETSRVLAAIEAVVALNVEAGVPSDSLNRIARYAATDGGKEVFRGFSRELVGKIHLCFQHFSQVMPQLAKGRAHRDFHQARLKDIPSMWSKFTSKAGLDEVEPVDLQAVSRHLFDLSMTEFFAMIKKSKKRSDVTVKLLADEENAVRYASGFVGMKLLKIYAQKEGVKAAQKRECLRAMAQCGNDSHFYSTLQSGCRALTGVVSSPSMMQHLGFSKPLRFVRGSCFQITSENMTRAPASRSSAIKS